MLDKVKDIFSDYSNKQENINEADFLKANLYKKSNRLELCLTSKLQISIDEISNFEDYIIDRFKVGSARIEIKYEDIDIEPTIEKDWKKLVGYMSKKEPMTRAILTNSTVKVEDSTISVGLKIKGEDLLTSKKFDKGLEHLVYNLYNKHFKVNFEEEKKYSKEEYEQYLKVQEHEAILHVQEMARKEAEERAIQKAKQEEMQRQMMAEQMESEGANGEVAVSPDGLIFGKTANFKSNFAAIENINDSTSKVNIEGEITNVSTREIKNNRTIVNFSVDDGNASIICKAFIDTVLIPGILQKIKEGQGIKVDGTAKFDDYANEITIMANNAVTSNFKISGKTDEGSENEAKSDEQSPLIYGRSMSIKTPKINIIDINNDTDRVCLEGEVVLIGDPRDIKGDRTIISFNLYDGTSTMTIKAFIETKKSKEILGRLKKAKGIKLDGVAKYDNFAKEITVMANTILETQGVTKTKRMDNAPEKRVELHMHTQMSQMDAVTSAEDLLKRAVSWGWKSIAITDHGVVQSFPEAHKFLGKSGADIKVIYGVEAYFVPDKDPSVNRPDKQDIDGEYCVLDLETTGLSFRTEKITEVGIIKIKNGEVVDEFECFVNPEKPIPQEVVEVTHITDEMVKDAETIDKVIPKIIDFIGDSVLVAHNADFDIGFLKHNFEEYGYSLENTYIDTLRLAKVIFPEMKKYKLGMIADKLEIEVEVAHRALDDVKTLVQVFNVMIEKLKEKGAKTVNDIDIVFAGDPDAYKKLPSYHAIILAKDYVGLKNLYKLVSYSHLDYFYKKPRILKSLFEKYREGLILGSACEAGELYRAIVAGKSDEDIEAIAKYYDYLEIQPLGNNQYMVRNGTVADDFELQNINRKIVELGDRLGKPVVATCDVHFMDPQDEIYRRILQAGQKYDDADFQAPLYLRTTEEMLDEFAYLGEEKAYEVCVTNTNLISDMCDKISPISDEKCPPHIEGCEQTIKDIAYDKAHELYGEELPEIVQSRLDKELDSIIKNGFSVMYIIAQKLVWKSNEDGYIVGSRGSVGSSFVANMTGITEVNSLQPHYRCPNCKYSDFTDYGVKNGFDLPDKDCPKCGHKLDKDGMDIPFETFLGFNGDKEPDIDLNFSGEYQAKAHRYTEVIFGKGTTFKAGTVGTVADKTAYGYVKNYYEERHIPVTSAEISRISTGCTGIKRTTGQHPGGIIVVPKGREIFEFCPVQHPADDPNSDIVTTHFDYHSIDQNLLKLDILGHDDPTMIRMLFDLTGIDPTKVPLDDKETMSIFKSTEALGVTPEQIHSEVGTFGVPEFGTKFVRGMLVDTKPTTFAELISISGLSHGTDVWLNNAQELINQGIVNLSQAIGCRDDIMVYLMKMGLEPNHAFKIMETVRKGKALKDPEKWAEYVQMMKDHDVPEWYIKSCEKIKYMFPKAHAAAYVTNAFRIAWFKVHKPEAYYTAYFTIRADGFDYDIMCHGKEKVLNKMREIDMAGNAALPKDKDLYPILELVLEMYERGIKFLPVDLYESDATKFKMEEDGIRPPLNSVPGLGTVAALSIQAAREEEKFMCIDDLQLRGKVGKSVIEVLAKQGCLDGMTQSNQMSLFA